MLVLPENPVENRVTIVTVSDAFHPELKRRQKCHEEGVEELAIYLCEAEPANHEHKELDELSNDSAVDKLVQDNFGAIVSHGSMLEEQVREAINVPHLDVRHCKSV